MPYVGEIHYAPEETMSALYDAGAHVGGKEWLSLHKNENHFVSTKYLYSSLFGNGLLANLAQYPDSQAIELRSRLAKRYGVKIENIYVGNGSDGVLADILTVLHAKHHTINLPEIGYKVYDILARRHRLRVVRYPPPPEPLNPGPGIWLIDSPNAITGSLFDFGLMSRLSEDPNATVVWDNCYGDFEQFSLDVSALDRIAVVRSFSKYYGLAGLRIGYCICDASLVSALESNKDIYNVNFMAQHLASMALASPEDFRVSADAMIQVRSELREHLVGRGFHVNQSHGNFLFVRHSTKAAPEIKLGLEGYKIAVRHFDFPETMDGLRITVPARNDVSRLLTAIDAVI